MEMSIAHFRMVCISSFQCAYNFIITSNSCQRRVSIVLCDKFADISFYRCIDKVGIYNMYVHICVVIG